MKKIFLFKLTFAAALIALALQSCKKDNHDYLLDSQQFVTQASSSNNFEVQAGALAVIKGQSDVVKHYGEHMVSDHTAVGREMKVLADSKGWTIPTSLQPKEQASLNLLASANNADFDREFAHIMVLSHQDAIDLFSRAAGYQGVNDADLRAFADSKLPSLKLHLNDAIQLQTQVR